MPMYGAVMGTCIRQRHSRLMMYSDDIVIDDEQIQQKIMIEKIVVSCKSKGASHDITLSDDNDNTYKMYVRQNKKIANSFSCGIRCILSDGRDFTLRRYNGPSHSHTNKLEDQKIDKVAHIHQATQRYQEKGLKEDLYAEESDRFSKLSEALNCLCEDCHITDPDHLLPQPELFDTEIQG